MHDFTTPFKIYNFAHDLFTSVSFSTTPQSVSAKIFLNFSKLPLRYMKISSLLTFSL